MFISHLNKKIMVNSQSEFKIFDEKIKMSL
jgi:hypothetical protein